MTLFVGNLPLTTTEEELRRECAAFGQVVSVHLMNDKYLGSGRPRVYGFVEMASKAESDAVVAGLRGKRLDGRLIEVIEALPVSPNRSKGSHSKKAGRLSRGRP
jgi:RNA recognition motif-containing protein